MGSDGGDLNPGWLLQTHNAERSPKLNMGSFAGYSHPLALGWEQCLDLKSGLVFFTNSITGATTDSRPPLDCSGSCKSSCFWNGDHMIGCRLDLDHASSAGSCVNTLVDSPEHRSASAPFDLDLSLSLKRSADPSSNLPSSLTCMTVTHHSDNHDVNRQITDKVAIDPSPDHLLAFTMCPHNSSTSVASFQPEYEQADVLSRPRLFGIELNNKEDEGEEESMITAGCQKCLMYVLLSRRDPRCPRCGNRVLLDISTSNDEP